VAISHSVNTQDANGENPTPAISLTILTNSLPGGMVGEAYNASLSAIGGKGTRTWTATGLPAGLTVSGALALISGTPQASGTFSVTITVTDQAIPPHVRSKTLSMAIIPALQISNASLPDGTVGQAYSGTVNTAGGNAPRFVTVNPSMANFGLAFDGVTIHGTPVGDSDHRFRL